ncbi:ATP-binding protein, partial [bacterium]|nr:ATP-binding protein [bacterium]
MFQEKVKRIHEDIILVTDNYALNFVLKYRDELFPGIPIVFCGINSFNPSLVKDVPMITGVVERSDIIGTLELALKLQPNK